MNLLTRVLFVLVLLAVAAGGYWFFVGKESGNRYSSYQTAAVKRGEVVARIGATGTVEPEELVDVGAQVAGQIKTFGIDTTGNPIDYGSVVTPGQVLATIDDSLYAADVAGAKATLAQSNAGVTRAEADIIVAEAKLSQASADWQRAQKLRPSDALAATAYDGYKAGYETAAAGLDVAKAALVQAKASVAQAETGLQRAERNLGFCVIRSPVGGVVIDRRVNIGQTVVSSLNAPSLFLIAKDLKRMQVWVAVNEADIGQIKPGMPVEFTVDAFPEKKFRGSVGKVRLNATMTQNIVSYTVEVDTTNNDNLLLPYLTAAVQFETGRKDAVLLVPNAALRWKPDDAPDKPIAKEKSPVRHGTVYTLDGDTPREIPVTVGLTDGMLTEISGTGISEGLEVITGESVPETTSQATTNPFAPKMPRGRHKM